MRLGFRRGGARLGLLGLLVGGVMLTLLVGSSAAAPVCGGGTCTETFTFTGGAQTWTVPDGVTSATFDVQGAQGGGFDGDFANCLGVTLDGGKGGKATGTFAVTPGATLQVNVGGQGGGCSTSGISLAGGFNGGGPGGNTGGGGGSDVRSGSYAFADRIIVAGGGGGSAFQGSAGGVGGGTSGGDSTPPRGGKGGTQAIGGDGGISNCLPLPGPVGGTGDLGTGGAGVAGAVNSPGGSGGGGGYYGGGGGGQGASGCPNGAGGGGSGFVDPSATSTSMESGVRSGNGLVTITYAEPLLYNFTGFFRPISNLPVINVVNAGKGIAIKFSLTGSQGLNIFAAGSPASIPLDPSCISGGAVAEPTSPAGKSGLSYNPTTDTYSYNWKTQKSWKGTCRQFDLGLNDGTFHSALFRFK
jgi:Glycine rich protein